MVASVGKSARRILCVTLPGRWVDADGFETSLLASGGAHEAPLASEVVFRFAPGSRLMLDAALRLLSLANQLSLFGRTVTIDFGRPDSDAMGYLNRIGFFDYLDSNVDVIPARPAYSAAQVHMGRNGNLVEIEPLRTCGGSFDRGLPTRLTDSLLRACPKRADANQLEATTWNLFSELISNVFDHSQSPIDGYAALQLYRNGHRVQVVVSDSGLGIINTLRPALAHEPRFAVMSDTELVVEAFRNGLSRRPGHGTGLRSCARHAMEFNATLDVRLDHRRVTLVPDGNAYQATALGFERQARLDGTHITFGFRLA